MHAIIEPTATDLYCHLDGAPAELRLDSADALRRLQAWTVRCREAARANNDDALLAIGREIFAWLNIPTWISTWARGEGPQRLEIRAANPDEPLAAALLACPWELLADVQGFIAADPARPFEIVRVRGEASAEDIEAAAGAVARRGFAENLLAENRLDEALEILGNEVLAVFERLDDNREKAITQGRIADVLFAQGKLDEAMTMQIDRLPAVTALGDHEGLAVL